MSYVILIYAMWFVEGINEGQSRNLPDIELRSKHAQPTRLVRRAQLVPEVVLSLLYRAASRLLKLVRKIYRFNLIVLETRTDCIVHELWFKSARD